MIGAMTEDGTAVADASAEGEVPVVVFPEGIPGFPELTRYALVRLDDAGVVLDLQSVEDDSVRFVVVPSVAFFPDYAPEIDEATAARLGLLEQGDGAPEPLVLLVVTVGPTLAESTANLLAPIVVNSADQVAAQVVLDDPTLPLRAPLPIA